MLASIERLFREIMPAPLRLWRSATADLPTAADYTGAIVWNGTTSILTWSNGSAWVQPSLSTHVHAASAITFAPAGAISSTNVQAAIVELDTEKAAAVHGHAIADVTGLQTALDAKQPLDTDLTAIAALTTTPYGRALLGLADAAALRALTRNGCMVTKTTGLTSLNFSAGLTITWDSEAYDDGAWHDPAVNNERMTVPAGVTRVEGCANIRLANVTANTHVVLSVLKNGTVIAQQAGTANTTSPALSATFADACVAGDYFAVNVFTADTSADINSAGSNFVIRAV